MSAQYMPYGMFCYMSCYITHSKLYYILCYLQHINLNICFIIHHMPYFMICYMYLYIYHILFPSSYFIICHTLCSNVCLIRSLNIFLSVCNHYMHDYIIRHIIWYTPGYIIGHIIVCIIRHMFTYIIKDSLHYSLAVLIQC